VAFHFECTILVADRRYQIESTSADCPDLVRLLTVSGRDAVVERRIQFVFSSAGHCIYQDQVDPGMDLKIGDPRPMPERE